MRRLGEVSVDGVVDFVDGSRFRPGQALELEMSLAKVASSDDVELVREAVTALGTLGSVAVDVAPTLEWRTQHEDPQVRELAKAALRQIRN